MPSPEPDSPQVNDVRLEFTIESLTFRGLAGAYDRSVIIPDGEHVKLDESEIHGRTGLEVHRSAPSQAPAESTSLCHCSGLGEDHRGD
jgi:hypothetical protein